MWIKVIISVKKFGDDMSKRKSHYIQNEFILMLLLFIIVSLLGIYNAEQLEQYAGGNYVIKQAIWYAAGISFIFALFFVELEQIYKTSIFIYAFGVVILIILRLSPESIARTINGAKSWFTGLGFLSLQPSEFTKIALIIFIAAIISHHHEKYAASTLKSD